MDNVVTHLQQGILRRPSWQRFKVAAGDVCPALHLSARLLNDPMHPQLP